jgi:hypothetical protein
MKIIEKTFDIVSGQETIVERDETKEETKDRLEAEKIKAQAIAKAEEKSIEKTAVLQKLGLTAEEVAVLLS